MHMIKVQSYNALYIVTWLKTANQETATKNERFFWMVTPQKHLNSQY